MSDTPKPPVTTGTQAQPPVPTPAVQTASGTAGAATFPPAPEGFVNVLVDGKHAVVPAKDNLIDAAKKVNVEIPYFCYHPRLSIAGQCRMCLVETSEMPGRLVAGCQVRVKEGMQIKTDTPPIIENQRAVMEFHLVNHPVDCPICDQSGECKLQDYYMKYDHKASRIATYKVNKPKRKVFGPLVVYDGERCILCTRCVRFMNEVAEEPQIAMVGRGDHSEIDTVPGKQLDSKYSGNTVDICPVGALLNRDFRFTSRVWNLESERTVCGGCANGCNMAADHRADTIYRLLPKRNEEVNQVWLCDDGRVSYHRTNDNRVTGARIGRADEGVWPTPDATVDAVRDTLKPLVGKPGLAVSLSATCTTEELFAFATFAKDVLGVSKVYASGRPSGAGDDFLIREDKNPNTNGVKLAAQAAGLSVAPFAELLSSVESGATTSLVMLGAEVPTDEAKTAEVLSTLTNLVVFAVNESEVTAAATLLLPLSSHMEFEGTFVNYYGRLQRFNQIVPPKADSLPGWAWVTKLSNAFGSAWRFMSAQDVFGPLAAKGGAFAGLSFNELPFTGVVLPGLAPAQFAKRAPRPEAAAAAS